MFENVTVVGRLSLVSFVAVMAGHVPLPAMAHSAFCSLDGRKDGEGVVTVNYAPREHELVVPQAVSGVGGGSEKLADGAAACAGQVFEEEREESSDGDYASATGSDGDLDGVAELMRSLSIAHPTSASPTDFELASAQPAPARRLAPLVSSFGYSFTTQRPLIVILCRIWKVMPDRLCQEGIDILVAALDQPFTADKVDQQKLRAAISAFLNKWFGGPTSLSSGERGGMNNHKWRTELADALIQAEVGREIAEALSREFDHAAAQILIERLSRATESAEVFRGGGESSGCNPC